MELWQLLGLIFVVGFVGGLVTALTSDNGFALPQKVQADGKTILRPGFLTPAVLGGVAALLSFVLYDPAVIGIVIGGTTPPPGTTPPSYGIPLLQLGAAAITGMGGSKWLTNEVDKKLLQDATTTLAGKIPPKPDDDSLLALGDVPVNTAAQNQIRSATPANALELARKM